MVERLVLGLYLRSKELVQTISPEPRFTAKKGLLLGDRPETSPYKNILQ